MKTYILSFVIFLALNSCDNGKLANNDPCKSWDCGENGVCLVSANQSPFCDCDEGYFEENGVCVIENHAPEFTSTPGTSAFYDILFKYSVSCKDPDGQEPTISLSEKDTCNGQINNGEYTFIQTDQTETSCTLSILCSDGIETVEQLEVINLVAARKWDKISRDGSFVCGISQGDLFCWGTEDCFCERFYYDTPQKYHTNLPQETDIFWTEISVGFGVSCGIGNGQLFCKGDNMYGGVGIGEGYDFYCGSFFQIDTDTDWEKPSCGTDHCCAIKSGSLYCWGNNDTGAVGVNTGEIAIWHPTQVGEAGGWTHVNCGSMSTCAIRNGELYCWGRNGYGGLGLGTSEWYLDLFEPAKVGQAQDWFDVRIEGWTACGVRGEGDLYCWGQLISDSTDLLLEPTDMEMSGVDALTSVDENFICFLSQGDLICRAMNNSGQLGQGNTNQYDDFVSIPSPDGTEWSGHGGDISGSCGISGGNLYCWGNGNYNNGIGNYWLFEDMTPLNITQNFGWESIYTVGGKFCGLRNGSLQCVGRTPPYPDTDECDNCSISYTPSTVPGTEGWTRVFNNNLHVLSVFGIKDGELYAFGNNVAGQLGLGYASMEWENDAQRVGEYNDWISVSNSYDLTCGIRNNGRIYCWGRLADFEAGTWNNDLTLEPVLIDERDSWTEVTIGAGGICASRDEGDLYCKGFNTLGALGLGEIQNTDSFTKVEVPYPVEMLSVGSTHMCGIFGGYLYCSGMNSENQFGITTLADRSNEFIRVDERHGWQAVVSGSNRNMGILNGELYYWGSGAMIKSSLYEKVSEFNDWESVSFEYNYMCALRQGKIYCLGSDSYLLITKNPPFSPQIILIPSGE